MALNPDAIATVVKKEIERQQTNVDYDSLSMPELEVLVNQLSAKLEMCKEALSTRGGQPKAAAAKGKFPDLPFNKPDGTQDADKIKAYITEQMSKRIMVLDGAMGTAIQAYKFTEEDFRKGHFEDHPGEIKGNNDLLVFSQVRARTQRRARPNGSQVPTLMAALCLCWIAAGYHP